MSSKFEQDVVYSVMVGTFRVLIHVAKSSNAINGNVQSVSPVISNTFSDKRTLARSLQASHLKGEHERVA